MTDRPGCDSVCMESLPPDDRPPQQSRLAKLLGSEPLGDGCIVMTFDDGSSELIPPRDADDPGADNSSPPSFAN